LAFRVFSPSWFLYCDSLIVGAFKMIAKAISETKRILRLTRKPKRSEFTETSKICAAGIVICGFTGFIIFLLFKLVIDKI
jgi:protein transport protein SEC61 subunit gamma and related proteins